MSRSTKGPFSGTLCTASAGRWTPGRRPGPGAGRRGGGGGGGAPPPGGAGHELLRCVVAAHGVDGNARARGGARLEADADGVAGPGGVSGRPRGGSGGRR